MSPRSLLLSRTGCEANLGLILQRKCACGTHTGVAAKCSECAKQSSVLQRRSAGADVEQVPPIVHDVLRSPGQPLDAATRAFMEPRFGRDFSGVRVHTDARAAESARAVNAHAYTVGNNVVFGTDKHQPHSEAGRRLMAHELTHVVQQGAGSPSGVLSLGDPASEYEARASEVSEKIDAPPVHIRSTDKTVVQRELSAYKNEKYESLPSFAGDSGATTAVVYSGDAAVIQAALAGPIAVGEVTFTGDAEKVMFSSSASTASKSEVALNAAGFAKAAEMAKAIADPHNEYLFSNSRIHKIYTIAGAFSVGKSKDNVNRALERSLTEFEKREARLVFGASVSLDQIRVAEDPIMSVGGYARTTPWTINFPVGSFGRPDFMPWLIHELTHSWQYSRGVSLRKTLYHAIFSTYDYGGEAGLLRANKMGISFVEAFNTEQQGDILQDYYIRLQAGKSVAAWAPFIKEVQNP